MQYELTTTQGDLLEFDLMLRTTCAPRPLEQGEQMFFVTDADEAGTTIDITQASNHFKIDEVPLLPGAYPFRAGIIYANGLRNTVFPSEDSLLIVRGY